MFLFNLTGWFCDPVLWNYSRTAVCALHQHVSDTRSSARYWHDAETRLRCDIVWDYAVLPTQQFRLVSSRLYDRPQKSENHLEFIINIHILFMIVFISCSLNSSKRIFIQTRQETYLLYRPKNGLPAKMRTLFSFRWDPVATCRPTKIWRFVYYSFNAYLTCKSQTF